jgi:predicted nucleic acid-binding protein
MLDSLFLDTNIILYLSLIPKNELDRQKKKIAEDIFSQSNSMIVISTQVLNEASNVLLKKSSFTKREIIEFLHELIADTFVVPMSSDITFNAIEISTQYKFSFYDSLIVASALSADCSSLITEDLQNQQVISFQDCEIQIINPFQEVVL